MFRHSPLSVSPANSKVSVGGRSPQSLELGLDNGRSDGSFPIDLIRFSIRAEKRKQKKHHTPQANYLYEHAAPLISINNRDVTMLDELFWRDDIAEIAADVNAALKQFLPTPCWEDDPFDVVKILIEAPN